MKIRLLILINTADVVKFLELNPTASLFDCLCQLAACDDNGTVSSFIGDYIVNGHTLILLDGLDVISDLQTQKRVIMLINQFIKSVFNDNPLVITSCSSQALLEL
ncbi:unnamed protein product [Didymodactylos carnosus]|uniref:ATPase AAA-type core domain-containing protein n=1 Tax=Didymodactylos carnosus TaxID=1234261 RepID=A0A816D156_9BILA|nr:unnamed protein product [Didymodactylos carnosus]CAF1627224.1 unnamed protein product [Didymodactylos carnosus]CAF4429860.1 unnamed protein product [Didymodactylos carnosus]CAF4522401.1 unnamed protein product [Didymodactylos carnosus]